MRTLFTCLCLILLTACSPGPNVDVVRADVGERLEQALPDNMIELADVKRMGSQTDTRAPAGETRRIVYFDAQLKLLRDVDFGAWNAPGVAGLISALGAGPRGIEGIKSGGNAAGDVIRAHGTALYHEQDGQWVSTVPAGYQPAIAPSVATEEQGVNATLAALRRVVEAFPRDQSPEQYAAIQQELSSAQINIRARLARLADGFAIAAGAEHGQYLRVARALFRPDGSRVVPLITQGGDENLQLLRAGKVPLAIAQADAAYDAYTGRGDFQADGPHQTLRGIASLYPEPMHVLVRGDGPLQSIQDLKGKRVAIGVPGSASRTTAIRVLQAHGLELGDITPLALSIQEELLALEQNRVDAVMQVIGVPADSVRALITEIPVRMLPLFPAAIDSLTSHAAGYFPYTISSGTYPGQEKDIATVATAALLLTDTTFSDAEITELVRRIFSKGRDYSALGSAQGAQISLQTSRMGLPVPIHPAAIQALEGLESDTQTPAQP